MRLKIQPALSLFLIPATGFTQSGMEQRNLTSAGSLITQRRLHWIVCTFKINLIYLCSVEISASKISFSLHSKHFWGVLFIFRCLNAQKLKQEWKKGERGKGNSSQFFVLSKSEKPHQKCLQCRLDLFEMVKFTSSFRALSDIHV